MQEEKKKNICLILPGKLPVPNIKGGAIETLLTLLIDQNEIEERVHFIVVCAWSDGIEDVVKKYKHTEFHFFKIRNSVWKKGINLINYIIARTTGNIDYFKTPMHYDIEDIIKTIQTDYVVVEHGIYKHFEFLRKYYKREQLCLHLHGTGPLPDKKTRETFGKVITVSEFVRDLYEPNYKISGVKFSVVLNGIDDSTFKNNFTSLERDEIRGKFRVAKDDFLIIYVGRLVKEKGVKALIEGILQCGNPKIKLMIVGSSNFKEESMTTYIRELKDLVHNHEDCVFFTGYIPNGELYKYYKSADLHAVCSICEEAAGLVVIEGQICGLPLLITNSGGINEYIVSDSIYVVQKRNALYNEHDARLLAKDISDMISQCYSESKKRKENIKICNDAISKYGAAAFYERFLGAIE